MSGNCHPRFDAEQPHELPRFVRIVALFSVCQIGLTISATGRSGFGKTAAGTPDCAMKSCAALDTVNAAAKTTPIVIRIIEGLNGSMPGRLISTRSGELVKARLYASHLPTGDRVRSVRGLFSYSRSPTFW